MESREERGISERREGHQSGERHIREERGTSEWREGHQRGARDIREERGTSERREGHQRGERDIVHFDLKLNHSSMKAPSSQQGSVQSDPETGWLFFKSEKPKNELFHVQPKPPESAFRLNWSSSKKGGILLKDTYLIFDILSLPFSTY
jgi:hypothetical protein